jgi:phage terminase large subunit-like protein
VVEGGHAALVAAGASLESGDEVPSVAEAIDFLFFVHDRHDGNLESSRRYLAWEQGLIAQLDADERAAFRLDEKGL